MSLYLTKQEVPDLEKTSNICIGKSKYLQIDYDGDGKLIFITESDLPAPLVKSRSVNYIYCSPKFSLTPTSFRIDNEFSEVSKANICDVLWNKSAAEIKYAKLHKNILQSEYHFIALFIEVIQSQPQSNEDFSLLIWDELLYIGYFKENKLVNSNVFDVSNLDEAMYYTMLFTQEYKINQEQSSITIYGDVDEQGSFEKELKTYFRKVETKSSNLVKDRTKSGAVYVLTSSKL